MISALGRSIATARIGPRHGFIPRPSGTAVSRPHHDRARQGRVGNKVPAGPYQAGATLSRKPNRLTSIPGAVIKRKFALVADTADARLVVLDIAFRA